MELGAWSVVWQGSPGGPIEQENTVLMASWADSQLWYSVPLIVTISLVYGATRHELMVPILQHAWRTAKWIVGFMLVIALILTLISWVC